MPNVFTVVAKIYPKPGREDELEQYRSEAAFQFHRTAPHLAEFQEQREDLIAKPVEAGIYRSLTD